jgi:hypothetical protein
MRVFHCAARMVIAAFISMPLLTELAFTEVGFAINMPLLAEL